MLTGLLIGLWATTARLKLLFVAVEGTFGAFGPVPASLADLLVVQDLRQILEHKFYALGHGNTQRPGDPA